MSGAGWGLLPALGPRSQCDPSWQGAQAPDRDCPSWSSAELLPVVAHQQPRVLPVLQHHPPLRRPGLRTARPRLHGPLTPTRHSRTLSSGTAGWGRRHVALDTSHGDVGCWRECGGGPAASPPPALDINKDQGAFAPFSLCQPGGVAGLGFHFSPGGTWCLGAAGSPVAALQDRPRSRWGHRSALGSRARGADLSPPLLYVAPYGS